MFSLKREGYWFPTSYGYNDGGANPNFDIRRGLGGNFMDMDDVSDAWLPTRESQVACPSDMIALGDATLIPDSFPVFHEPPSGVILLNMAVYSSIWCWNTVMLGLPAGDASVQGAQRRHGGRWNIAFCDGHTENLRAGRLFDIRQTAVAQRWNNDNQAHSLNGWSPPPPPY